MLSITTREFYNLIQAGKLHPIQSRQRHARVPLVEVLSLKAEVSHRALVLPYEKFIRSATFFTMNAVEINDKLAELKCPKAPLEYIERCRVAAEADSRIELIKEKSFGEFMQVLGVAREILKHDDLRLMTECLVMIQKGEKEIQDYIRGKYGREYATADILRFIEYFWNWRTMDPESVKFYFDFLTSREKVLKECAYRRADYFVYYALGIDFGGEIADLLERSTLGLIHKLNFLVDTYVYGESMISQKDLSNLTDVISNLLGAAQSCRMGRVPKGKQKELAEGMIPIAVSRDQFFETEKGTSFGTSPKVN